MASSVTLPGIGEGDTQRTEVSVRQIAQQVQTLATIDSPIFTGDPQAPTPLSSDNDTSIATTAFVKAQGYLTSAPVVSVAGRIGAIVLTPADVAGVATLASPAFTGAPTAPTASAGTNSTQLATTAYVDTGLGLKASLASPTFTGSPAAPTQASGDNSTKLATTAYADASAPWKLLKKTADQSITSSTTFVDDNDLKFAVAANSVYRFRVCIIWNNGTQSKHAFNGPAGGTLRVSYPNSAGAVTTAYDTLVSAPAATTITLWVMEGTFQNGATAGTLALRLAQFTSSATASVLEKGSTLEWTKIS